MSDLEARYRRILTLLPRAYRQQRAEEMLTVLLDGAPEGARWPRVGEAASVVGLAVRVRAGAPGGSPRALFGGRVLRRIGVAGLVIQALLYIHNPVFYLSKGLRQGYSRGLSVPLHHISLLVGRGLIASLVLLPVAALAALLYGWRRTGRALAVGPCVLATANLVATAQFDGEAGYAALAALSYLVAGAVMLGFHRDAPPPARRGLWLALTCALLVAAAAVVFAGDQLMPPASAPAHGTVLTAQRLEAFVLSPLGPALAIGAALVCARTSAVWPAALFALGLPLLLITPRGYTLIAHSWRPDVIPSGLAPDVWPGFDLQCRVAEVVLAIVLAWSLRRQHRHRATHSEPRTAAAD